jgi:hypothetical protein
VTRSLPAFLARIIGFSREFDRQIRPAPRMRTRLRAGRAVVWFALATLAINAGVLCLLDELRPGIRDPEYGRRIRRLQARIAENPGRPIVLFVGSSRTALGICPGAWEAIRPGVPGCPDPLFFNLSLLGGGPIVELMILHRLFADGLRPAAVLIEYWPPYLHDGGGWAETNRMGSERLYPIDRAIVRDYFPDPGDVERKMRRYQSNPVYANRERLLVQLMSGWLRPTQRGDSGWNGLDPWGWLPGRDWNPGPSELRSSALAESSDRYKPLFANYRISPNADRAIGEAVKLARKHSVAVGFIYMPESSEFRGWYSSAAEHAANEHLAGLSHDLGVSVIDARTWMDDGLLVDGFHLSQIGAAEFTRKLAPGIASTFPELRVHP